MSEEELKKDTFLRVILQEQSVPNLPRDFTSQIMAKVEQEAATKARIYKPLIAPGIWRKIAIGFGTLLLGQLLIGIWVITQWEEMSLSVKLISHNFVNSLQISRNLDYVPQLATVLVICIGLYLVDKLRDYFTSGNRRI